MKIQRYDLGYDKNGDLSIVVDADGEYIKRADVLALLDKIDADFHDETAWSVTTRVRNLIEKELAK